MDSMVVLGRSGNLLLVYVGWEGVGLCGYLWIGVYHGGPKNGAAAMKAVVVTPVGDVFLSFALSIPDHDLGPPIFREMVELSPSHFSYANNMLLVPSLLPLRGPVAQ